MIKNRILNLLQIDSILHPGFALRLINCLAGAFVMGVMGCIAMYGYASVTAEISDYRKVFNNGYTQGRDFFESSELLLSGLIKSIDIFPEANSQNNTLDKKTFYLGTGTLAGRGEGVLYLSGQRQEELRQSGINLIYVNRLSAQVRYIFKAQADTPDHLSLIAAKLHSFEPESNVGAIKIFRLGSGSNRKSYIFEPISSRAIPGAWLGVEVPYSQVRDSIKQQLDAAAHLSIKFLVLDENGLPVEESGSKLEGKGQLDANFLNVLKNASDGFSNVGAPVFKIFLKKELGRGQRWIVYYADYLDVVAQVKYSFLWGALLLIAALVSAVLLLKYVKKAVFLPAQEQATQLLEREAFNRTMLALAPVGICVLNRESGELLLQSEKAKRLLELQVEVDGQRQSLQAYFLSVPVNDPLEPFRSGVTAFSVTDQSPRHIQFSLAALHYHEQPVLFCSFVDDSARRNTELMLAAAKQASDVANAAKSTFLAMMSHEIRTPLYGVLGTLELLGRTELQSQQRDYLDVIGFSSGNLLQIINDILDFSKVEANQMVLECAPFNAVEFVEAVVRGFVPLALKKRVQLQCYLPPDLPLLVGDRNRLQQVLSNLLSNAVKFTDCGKIVVRLYGHESRPGHCAIKLQVADSGIGIAKAQQDMLFEPFIQADTSISRRFGGTGLGLSVCSKLAQLMGGQIDLVSELGLGSSFTLSLELPIAQPALSICLNGRPKVQILVDTCDQYDALNALISHAGAQVEAWSPSLHPAPGTLLVVGTYGLADTVVDGFAGVVWLDLEGLPTPQWRENGWHVSYVSQQGLLQALHMLCGAPAVALNQVHVPIPGFNNLRVLAVEDHPVNQLLLAEQLEQLGCIVTMASDGAEALQRWLRGETYDVMLTDVNMPRLDGYQLVRQLRQQGITVPIIGITANALAEDEERCRLAGMDAHLGKPVSLQGLRQVLEGVLLNKDRLEGPKVAIHSQQPGCSQAY